MNKYDVNCEGLGHRRTATLWGYLVVKLGTGEVESKMRESGRLGEDLSG